MVSTMALWRDVDCGLCARYATRSKYLISKRFVPPSVPPPTILDDTISVKCCDDRYSRKYLRTAA
jgi:hypothetical protein